MRASQATGILDQANARANEIVEEGKDRRWRQGTRSPDRCGARRRSSRKPTAREELRGQVSAIAIAGAEKILNREIDASAHEDILGKLASEL